ncbi:MAG: hypothetical protein E7D89_07255 [Veillonella sp.]|nr:hypothetical protein [Veillonella sp.]MDU2347488.1 hypothetical protein [Veillonella sp.]
MHSFVPMNPKYILVATVLTACGIETQNYQSYYRHQIHVATVLTVYGIETFEFFF